MHRGKVDRLPVLSILKEKVKVDKYFYSGDCDCGWQGGTWENILQAQAELDEHLKEVG